MTGRTTRRRYVGAAIGVGFAAVAGCTEAGPGEDGDEPGDEGYENGNESGNGGGDGGDDNETVEHDEQRGEVRFVRPEDGDTVSNPVEVELEVEAFELEPAEEPPPEEDESVGEENETGDHEDEDENGDEEQENGGDAGDENGEDGEPGSEDGRGHLHVIVDEGCLDPGRAIPFADEYHHLGDGESEITIELEPGEHDLCAQASDGAHAAYDVTHEITIEVEDAEDGDGEDGNVGEEDGEGNESDGNESDEESGGDGNETDGDG